MTNETHENRLKRLKMRSWRRGMREMDLILGPFSDWGLDGLDAQMLDIYEQLLEENDQDLYVWFSGRSDFPEKYQSLTDVISSETGNF